MERSPYLDAMVSRHAIARDLPMPTEHCLYLHQSACVGYGAGNYQHMMHWDTLELPAAAMQVPGGLHSAIRDTWGLISGIGK